jgi:hypothetical protein
LQPRQLFAVSARVCALAVGGVKFTGKTYQIAVLSEAQGENFGRLLKVIRAEYRPGVVTAASVFPPEKDASALLHGLGLVDGKATAYVCEGFMCQQPTNDPEMLAKQLS